MVLEVVEDLIFSEIYYQRGLHYCFLNNARKAKVWLMLAERLGHRIANEVLIELKEKGLLDEEEIER